MAFRRLVLAALVAVPLAAAGATAGSVPPRAQQPGVATTDELVDVPLDGGGHVTVKVAAGGVRPVAGRRVATANEAKAGPGIAGVTPVDPATDDEAAVYPVGASTRTGTTV